MKVCALLKEANGLCWGGLLFQDSQVLVEMFGHPAQGLCVQESVRLAKRLNSSRFELPERRVIFQEILLQCFSF